MIGSARGEAKGSLEFLIRHFLVVSKLFEVIYELKALNFRVNLN